ncbi:helix-turn-helix domain-containing protein [Butyrivibrio sp. MC2013]|uniref:helix-turn-helix domain-containing protein n=1 Tax=Butyrivibrio sp. MC2013 TaxID=1280686 RepID=UPI00041B1375|nr:helix-turn-helix transcriptional regulator [Butyrivibrio sp. MC2013]
MTKAEILKKEILNQYKSVRRFAIDLGIPYSTLVTALERGIEGMAYGTVIRMCEALNLNPVDFTPLDKGSAMSNRIIESKVMQQYIKLNKPGRRKIMEMMSDFSSLEKYQA